jgi:hypothetical protein
VPDCGVEGIAPLFAAERAGSCCAKTEMGKQRKTAHRTEVNGFILPL